MRGNTVQELIATAVERGLPRLDAQMLVLLALGQDPHHRAWLLTHDTDQPSRDQAARFQQSLERRLSGEPMAYLLGHQEFFGLQLEVSPAVLVPRPDTETLVEWALDIIHDKWLPCPAPRVADLGTGSGAVALALAHNCKRAEVTATDNSTGALAIARRNADRLNLPIRLLEGSWWEPLKALNPFHLIVSNPPYIRVEDVHLPALRHEPGSALTAGEDGLDDIRELVAGAPTHLTRGGWLLMEHGHDQASKVRELMESAGFGSVTSRMDLAGIERCTGGCWASPS